ncbi:MAG TPA: alpha/beta hydrolase [Candidatus Saccharimonadales bacterium]|nr:alpha/beta hydrolase [Candidatus Saccharimonadales bacterium]
MSRIYIKAGSKEKIIVFLHGWGVYKETWKNLFPQLSNYYTLYALDLPGFGSNQDIPPKFVLDDYVKFLNDFLEQNSIHSCILVGHSFGANIAALFTVTYPEKVEKLVLYSGGLVLNTTSKKPQQFITYSLIFFSMVTRWIKNRKLNLNDYSILKNLYKNTHGRDKAVGNKQGIHQPVLLIAGRYDFLIPLSRFRMLGKLLPTSQLVVFNHSTHGAHREEKKKFLATLQNFLR